MQVSRTMVAADELRRRINSELSQYDATQSCEVMHLEKLTQSHGGSGNWRPGALSGSGPKDSSFIAVFARIVQRFRREFDIE